MAEIFIAIILGSYYLYKFVFISTGNRVHKAVQEDIDRNFKELCAKWVECVTDPELEERVKNAVSSTKKLRKYKTEIEDVLCSQFGFRNGFIDDVFIKWGDVNYDDSARKLFARILMANRGKLLESDATCGLCINEPKEWLHFDQLSREKSSSSTLKKEKYSIESLAYWINKQLNKNGIKEDVFLEMFYMSTKDDPRNLVCYKLETKKDYDCVARLRKFPSRGLVRHSTMPSVEQIMWGPSIKDYCSGSLTYKPAREYSFLRK